jgi:hypothetical protein
MNKYPLTPFFLLIIFLHVGCFSSKTVFDVPQKIVGEIMVVGNEPFTKLAVRAEDGKMDLISCNEEIRQLLLSHQGKITELFYDEIRRERSGDVINVIKVNFLSK